MFCVLGLLILPVPSQESERSICVLGLLILPDQVRRVSGHVFVYQGY